VESSHIALKPSHELLKKLFIHHRLQAVVLLDQGRLSIGRKLARSETMRAAIILAIALAAGPTFAAGSPSDARMEGCRAKLKQAQAIDLLHNMTFDKGIPKVWVGLTWAAIPIDAKQGFAETAACFFLGGDASKSIQFDILDGQTGKRVARWRFTRLTVD
jgi:hypothetical protein